MVKGKFGWNELWKFSHFLHPAFLLRRNQINWGCARVWQKSGCLCRRIGKKVITNHANAVLESSILLVHLPCAHVIAIHEPSNLPRTSWAFRLLSCAHGYHWRGRLNSAFRKNCYTRDRGLRVFTGAFVSMLEADAQNGQELDRNIEMHAMSLTHKHASICMEVSIS